MKRFHMTQLNNQWATLRREHIVLSSYVFTQKIKQSSAQYIYCIARDKKRWACWESWWSSDEHLLRPPFILLFSLSLFSLLWAVIDLISSSLNWSHDSCCSDWPSLTTHRHSSVMPSPIYLSICLCLLSLPVPWGKSCCRPQRATMSRFAPVCDYYYLLFICVIIIRNNV